MNTQGILFVCLGNICRSPTAEGVFRALLEREAPELQLDIDSAGTGAWHVGHPPDQRAQAAARARGYDISRIRARQVTRADFERFDLILAMDRDNLASLHGLCPPLQRNKLRRFLEFAETDVLDVPDPYYGGHDGFERVLDLIEDASRGLLRHLQERLAKRSSA